MPYELNSFGVPVWVPQTQTPGQLTGDVALNFQNALKALQTYSETQPAVQAQQVQTADLANRLAALKSQYGIQEAPLQAQVNVGDLQQKLAMQKYLQGVMQGTTPGAQAPTAGAPDAQRFNNLMSQYQQLSKMPGAEAVASTLSGQIRQMLNTNPNLGSTMTVDPTTGKAIRTNIDPQSLEFKREETAPEKSADDISKLLFGHSYFDPALTNEQRAKVDSWIRSNELGFRQEMGVDPKASDETMYKQIYPELVQYLRKGSFPVGRSATTQARLMGFLPRFFQEKGIAPEDASVVTDRIAEINKSQDLLQKQLGTSERADGTLEKHLARAQSLWNDLKKEGAFSGITKFNDAVLHLKSLTDNSKAQQFLFLMDNDVSNEYANVITNTSGSGGSTVTDRVSAKGEIDRLLTYTGNNFNAGADLIRKTAEDRLVTQRGLIKQQRNQIRDFLRDPKKALSEEQGELQQPEGYTPPSAPPGAEEWQTLPNGVKYRVK